MPYVDIDEDGNEIPNLAGETELQKRLLKAVGRKYFPNATKKEKFTKVEAKIDTAWLPGQRPPARYPLAFVIHQIEWAEKENKASRITKIKYDALISAIRNPDNWTRWLKRIEGEQGASVEEDRSGYSEPEGW